MTSVWDLDLMILERISAENLKPVSRVTKEWRSYIANNIPKMRPFLAEEIRIFYLSGLESHRIESHALLADCSCKCMGSHKILKKLESANMMIKYKPITFTLNGYDGKSMEEQMKNDMDALPSWWFKQITKVMIHLNDEYEAMFLSRFEHLSNAWVVVFNIDLFALFIETAPQVDTFNIFRLERTYCDFMLEVLLTKSYVYPLEFPTCSKECYFTLPTIINFIENNKFTNLDQHLIYIESRVVGKEKDFTDWVQSYSTSFTCLAQDHHLPRINELRPLIHCLKWNFEFRGEHFEVLIAGFNNN